MCVCASVCVTLFRDWTLSQRRAGPKSPELGKRPTKIRRLSTIKGQGLSCVFLSIPVMTLTLCRFLSLANRNHPAMHKYILIAVIFHICCVPVLFRVLTLGQAMLLVDRVGRKKMLLFSALAMMTCCWEPTKIPALAVHVQNTMPHYVSVS